MNIRTALFLFFAINLLACSAPQTQTVPETFVGKVEYAHKKKDFLAKEAIQFDIVVTFRENEILNAKMTLSTNSSKGLIELENGEKIYFNNDKVVHSPNLENSTQVRFTAFTWSYFFLFPYKLSDPGTIWNDTELETLNDRPYNTQKLTFEAGTGDAPDDWYILYADTKTNLTEVAAYIVTAGKTKMKAEEDPHAIKYLNYRAIDGIPIAHRWTFWEWRVEHGLMDQLGGAILENVQFVEVGDDFFDAPTDFIEEK